MGEPIRIAALSSTAKHRLIKGEPGVGKTFFGCELADYELCNPERGIKSYQRILSLTFSRNAAARIRQTFVKQIAGNSALTETEKIKKQKYINQHVKINTFAGFFWWLIDSYGRYADSNSSCCRPWLIGDERTGFEKIPNHYEGYTYKEITTKTYYILKNPAIQTLISDLYPLIIIDEFQDVDDELFDIIALLGQKSRLVLLCGPGQCIYRNLKKFDPESIMRKCEEVFRPEVFKIPPVSPDKQRHCPEIKSLVEQYNSGHVNNTRDWPVMFKPILRFTQGNRVKELETQTGKMLIDMKEYLKKRFPDKKSSVAVLTSTNVGVIKLFSRFREGNDNFKLRPIIATLHFKDTRLLQYGRLVLELLRGHWISCQSSDFIDKDSVCGMLASLFLHSGIKAKTSISEWQSLAEDLIIKTSRMKAPTNKEENQDKLARDIERMNDILKTSKEKLPLSISKNPLKNEGATLRVFSKELLRTITPAFRFDGLLRIDKAKELFESTMQQKIVYEKLGIEAGVQIMTIHKSKGREFDGVILVLEDSHDAIWKRKTEVDPEIEELYRVAISRARNAFGLIAYNDIFEEANPMVQKLLSKELFGKQKVRWKMYNKGQH